MRNTFTTTTDRDARTALALKAAKESVLAYVAATAANGSELYPGRLPCPEARNHVGTAYEGLAGPFPHPPAATPVVPCDGVGRLPWKTLGIDLLRDGYGEPLWLAVPTGSWAWVNVDDPLSINPGSPNQLSYDGAPNAVVAVVIAPGEAMNNLGESSGTKPGACSLVNQMSDRYAVPYSIANFLECGNATGAYTTIGPTTVDPGPPQRTISWSNDRTISITAAEVMDAIAGPVADRLQRQVAPALEEWRATDSVTDWGRSFLPFASTFNVVPTSNDLCGNVGTREGLLPSVTDSTGPCTRWGNGTVTQLLPWLWGAPNCVQTGTAMRCTFTGLSLTWPLGSLFSARVRADAPAASAFRGRISQSDITVTPAGSTLSNFSLTMDATGQAIVSVDVSRALGFFALTNFEVTIPNLPDAAWLSDARLTWFLRNGWDRYTYYTVSSAWTAQPGLNVCNAAGDPQCLKFTNLPAAFGNGPSDNKRFVLTLMGRAINAQTQPSSNPTDYLETHAVGSNTFDFNFGSVGTTINDRHAACPFQQTPAGPPIAICN